MNGQVVSPPVAGAGGGGTARTGSALVVATGPAGVPAWVRRWCRRADRPLRTEPRTGDQAAALADGAALLLTRGSTETSAPATVVAAVRELPADAPVLAAAADVARHLGATVLAVHAVPLSFGERSVGLADAVDRGRRTLDAAAGMLKPTGVPARVALVRRWPHEIVGEEAGADLLVVGSARRGRGTRPDPLVPFGPVTRSAAQHAPCPVLVVPRSP
ncbi:MAG: universal stress protein [Pseudonocardiales bacterium]|nr:universal stress protein [Pseudonocardiales bacterium]